MTVEDIMNYNSIEDFTLQSSDRLQNVIVYNKKIQKEVYMGAYCDMPYYLALNDVSSWKVIARDGDIYIYFRVI